MFRANRRQILIIPLLLAIATVAPAGEKSTVNESSLPAGVMQEKARAACSTCHENRIIIQQRLSRPAWVKEIDKMTKWGAEVDSKDRDALSDYFAATFGPDQPSYIAPRSASEAKKTAKK